MDCGEPMCLCGRCSNVPMLAGPTFSNIRSGASRPRKFQPWPGKMRKTKSFLKQNRPGCKDPALHLECQGPLAINNATKVPKHNLRTEG